MMKKNHPWKKLGKVLLWCVVALALLAIAGYIILNNMINKKFDDALKQMPEGLQVNYTSLHPRLLSSSIAIDDLSIIYSPKNKEKHQHNFSFGHITVNGVNFLKLISSKKISIHSVKLEKCTIDLDRYLVDKKIILPDIKINAPFTEVSIDKIELSDINGTTHAHNKDDLSFKGNFVLEGIIVDDIKKPLDTNNFHFTSVYGNISNLKYVIPETYESVHINNIMLDSKKELLQIDTCKIVPRLNKFEMGKQTGHQVDYIDGVCSGIEVKGLDIMKLIDKKLIAEKITIAKNNIYVFRDRRLPLDSSEKPMPVAYFKTLPVDVRVQSITANGMSFTYEEYPKIGHQTGVLKILRMHATVSPFINHPLSSDPVYITVKSEGSLMGSGTVEATTQMPMRNGDYVVHGAFHDLDVTTLNSSAENLGRLHIESGMLNSLAFEFNMSEEKSTGKIIGEYHNLVIDKLKDNEEEKKVSKLKSFFLKNLIIPKNKDKTLPEKKRTGKVDYKRKPERYFSFYLLHSLLTGVKSSFSLGFLLPG